MKKLIIVGTILGCIIIGLPAMLVVMFSEGNEEVATTVASPVTEDTPSLTPENASSVSIAVYRSAQNAMEEVLLEEYVIGVVASEMPVEFELEALKAQALTARTYIIKQMLNPADIGLPEGAVVTDTVMHQVYKNKKELETSWGKDFSWKYGRIKEAVLQTQGQILTYEGEPITAAFFSTSNGYTENSEDYWQSPYPYLRSVESPWDENSPRYKGTTVLSVQDFEKKLGVKLTADGKVGEIIERTNSNRVASVDINGKKFTGRQIREMLELDSADFQWQKQDNQIVIETKGWGHGIGMSQYGANGMAKEGMTYQEIVAYYYKGVDLSKIGDKETDIIVASNR